MGVGYGDDLKIAKKHFPESKLFGIDYFTENIEELNASGIKLEIANIESDELPFPDESLDLVIINQVLEHTKEIFWINHQISKKLKVGGYLIVGVPNIASFLNRILFLIGKQPSQMHSHSAHVRGYTHNEIPEFYNVCFPNGYEKVLHRGAQFYPFPKSLSRFFCKVFPSMSHCSFMLFKKTKTYNNGFIIHPVKAKLETNFFTGQKARI